MSDLVGNPEDRFSRVEAQLIQAFMAQNNQLFIYILPVFLYKVILQVQVKL